MKKYLLPLAVAMILFIPAHAQDDWADFGRYREANRTVPRGAPAVFMGNSIVEGWAEADPSFFADNGYVGRGIGGQVSAKMLMRFRADVLDLQPRAAVILAGTNDVTGNLGRMPPERILGNIASMAELARAHKIKVVLCAVLPIYEKGWAPGLEPAENIRKLNAMLEEYAAKNRFAYVDFHSALKGEDGMKPEYTLDGVHPSPEGYRVMESLLRPVLEKATGRRSR